MGTDAKLTLEVEGKDTSGSKVLKGLADEAERTEKAVGGVADAAGFDKLTGDIVDARKEVERLFSEFQKAERDFQQAELGKGFKEGSKEARDLRKEVVRTGLAVTDFADKNREVEGTAKAFRRVRASTKRARKELERFNKTGIDIGKVLKSVTSLRTGVVALLAAMAVNVIQRFTSAATELGKASADLKGKVDGARLALREIGGSATAASGSLEFLDELSDRLGVGVVSLTDGFVNLSAATRGTAVAGKDTEEVFEALTATGVAFGKSQESIGRAINAVSQIAGKGVAQMEELRQQLGENIPGALQALASGLQQIRPDFDGTVASLFELTAAGKLTAEEAIPALTIGLNELAGTAADDAMETLAGRLRVVSKVAEDAKLALADELEPGLLRLLKTVADNSDEIEKFAAGLGGLFSDVADGLSVVVEALDDVNTGLKGFAEEFPAIFDALGLDDLKDSLIDVGSEGEKAFKRIEESAILAGQGIIDANEEGAEGAAKSFDGIRKAAEESFKEQTKAAKLSNAARTQLAEELARNLGRIADRDIQFRSNLQARLTDAVGQSHNERRALEEETFRIVSQLAERQREANDEAVRDAIEGARRVAAAEARATQQREDAIRGFADLAKFEAEERVAGESEAAESIAKIEENLSRQREKLIAEFVAAAGLETEKRVEIERGVQQKIRDLELAAERQREQLAQRELARAEKLADDKVALEEKLQASLAGIRDAAKAPDEEADTGGDGAPVGLTETAAQVDTVTKSLSQLRQEVDELVRIGAQGKGLLDADAILRGKQAILDATFPLRAFGPVATQSAQEVGAATQEIKGRFDEVIAKIDETLKSEEFLASFREETAGAFQETLSSLIESFSTLAEAGLLTDADIQTLVETFTAFAGETAPENVDAITSIQESLAALSEKTEEQTEATEKQNEALKTQVKVVEDAEGNITILQEAREELADTEKEAVGVTEEVSEATEEAGEKARAAATPTGDLATQTERLASAAREASPGMQSLAAAADQLSAVSPPTDFAAAVDQIGASAPQAARGLQDAAQAARDLGATEQAVNALATALESLIPRLRAVRDAANEARDAVQALGDAQESIG
jgi:tape measure domain-containing protein